MKKETEYIIHFKGLHEGTYEYNYLINKKFFSTIEGSMYEDGNINVKLTFSKSMQMLILDFNIAGTVSSICDNCLESVEVPFICKEKICVKFGDEYDEPSEDVIILPFNEHEIDVSKIIYDLIVTSLPIRHLHNPNNNSKNGCNKEMLKKISEYSVFEPHIGIGKEDYSDPRWDKLKNIID